MLPAIEPTKLKRGGAEMECFLVPWDSEAFAFPVAQIVRLVVGDESRAKEMLDEFSLWCADRDVRLVSCRLGHLQIRESMALEEVGFRFIEMVYCPRLGPLGSLRPPRFVIQVAEASLADLSEIQAIARSSFTTGRYVLDGRLSADVSNERYARWVASSFDTPGHTVLKAEIGGDLVGFFIVEPHLDRSVYWHLTAIAPPWQGKGIGLSLWQTMLIRHATEGATAVETTISGHNLPALNLYARLGFAMTSAQMTFHWLRNPES